MRNNKGITLIALVVTIIVLIILALITLNTVLGDDGIINRAKKAKDKYEQAEQKELEDLGTLSDELGTLFEKDKEVVLKVGDYVDYKPTNGTFAKETLDTYSGSTENAALSTDNTLNWRILDVDDTTLTLISDEPTADELYLSGYQGYNNGVLLLNNICKTNYSNTTLNAVARSINMEDVEKATGYSGSTYNTAGQGKEGCYPLIFANEANGNVDKNGYGTLERSEQTEYILQTEETEGAELEAKVAYYQYEIKADNVDSKYVELIGYKTRNYRLS